MNVSKKRTLMSWVMALMILFSAFAPMSAALALDPEVTTEGLEDTVYNSGKQETEDQTITKDETINSGTPPVGEGSSSAPVVPKALLTPFAGATGDRSDILQNYIIKLLQDGTPLDETGILDPKKPVTVKVEFEVPVFGGMSGTPAREEYVGTGDTAALNLSDSFTIVTGDMIPILATDFETGDLIEVGKGTFGTDASNNAILDIVFDNVMVFGDASNYVEVFARFEASLQFNGNGTDNPDGTKTITILGKSFTFTVWNPPIIIDMEKKGTLQPDGRRILWEIAIDATQDGEPVVVDLVNKELYDDLTLVGNYVPGTFTVGDRPVSSGGTPVSPDIAVAEGKINYFLPHGTETPTTVYFETAILDADYYATSNKNINNTAELREAGKDPLTAGGSVTFIPPKWIVKTGVAKDLEGGTYDPDNRTITWVVIANPSGAPLNNVSIEDTLPGDLLYESAQWATAPAAIKWVTTDGGKWVSADTEADVVWTDRGASLSEPTDQKTYTYPDAAINQPIRLTIVSKIPPNAEGDPITGTTNYNNTARIRWDGNSVGLAASSGNIDVGHASITKTGSLVPRVGKTPDTIKWTVEVDVKKQAIPNLRVYDLLVYGSSSSFDKSSSTGWPVDMTADMLNKLDAKYEQKYKDPSFTDIAATGVSLILHPIYAADGTTRIADLMEISGLDINTKNHFAFETIVSPKIFAANAGGPSNRNWVHNTASLYGGNIIKFYSKSDAYVDYISSILAKEMIKREAVDQLSASPAVDAVANANKRTTSLSEGFHYIDKSVIYRLVVNADGIDLTDTGGSTDTVSGQITVTDVLPLGWEFVPLSQGTDYLIFSGVKSGNYVNATAQTTVSELSHHVTKGNETIEERATFTFTTLDQPYVILVKARPKPEVLADYFNNNKTTGSTTADKIANTLELTAQNWSINPKVEQRLTIKSELLTKSAPEKLPEGGALRWTVEYKPYNLTTLGELVRDTLPVGLDLRIDSTGKLILKEGAEEYITMREIILQPDGSYIDGSIVELVIGENVFYDNAARTLSFKIIDSTKGYRFIYITDVTGDVSRQN